MLLFRRRRRGIDSSSSSSSSSPSGSSGDKRLKKERKKREKREKRERKKREKQEKKERKEGGGSGQSNPLPIPSDHPPVYSPPSSAPPVSSYRIPLSGTSPFPALQTIGTPPCVDADGRSPVFLGSALLGQSVHPCKIVPHLSPACSVPYGGTEIGHPGRYDLLPFIPETMEFVRTSYGQIPSGRRPVGGGYEESGHKLYHAIGIVQGIRIPGKTGEHLGACHVAFDGAEHVIQQNYEILCWR